MKKRTGFDAVVLLLTLSCAFITNAQTRSRTRTVVANDFAGGDLGAKINAADRALGTGVGEILVRGGGLITTQIVLSPNHTLRLGPGTYSTKTSSIPILMKERTAIVGSGWDAIITESTAPGQFTVISAFNHAQKNGTADDGLLIRDVQIKGANPGFNSAPQAISLGNCSNCTVDHVWINGTRSIGIQLGGSAQFGKFAENSKVINSKFTRVASQNLALVNGRGILFEGNSFLTTGQTGGPGSTNIDLEPNGANDHLEDVIIRRNLIDVRGSEISPTGNGIVIQSGSGTSLIRNIVVEENTLIGGENKGTVTNVMSNGIYVFGVHMRDVTIRNNTITRTGQAGIRLEGDRFTVINNRLIDVGGGGNAGFVVRGVTNSRIADNTFTYSGAGPVDGRMLVSHGSRGNVFENNRGFDLSTQAP